ncbi:MAG TPA: carboxynorspermidine decarboxylase [Campylobacterales bacterium]|nr:carboxynorspermidine decarboxylase [Campylobacterales bacterium]
MLQTPYYLLKEEKLEENLKLLEYIQEQSGAKILLALKGFAFTSSFDLVSKYLQGCCASGLYEAKLAYEEFKKEVHTYSPAFKENEIDEILSISNHIIFNSFNQWQKYKEKALKADVSIGLRINPEVSASPKEIYNPCGLNSRLGITKKEFKPELLREVDGFHFHALCEQGSDELELVLNAFEKNFGEYLHELKWINFGGGHHITKDGYHVKKLIKLIKDFKNKYDVKVYLEPGEAVGWESGVLVAKVLDIVDNGMQIAILDTSAEAHMPDTIIMPYRSEVEGAKKAGVNPYTYQLAGNTCLAGDIMGNYSFKSPLKIGDEIIFKDQIHYTIVKNTTFNGIKLPNLVIERKDGTKELVKEFGYEEYKRRV